jgi:hypothetical protein
LNLLVVLPLKLVGGSESYIRLALSSVEGGGQAAEIPGTHQISLRPF